LGIQARTKMKHSWLVITFATGAIADEASSRPTQAQQPRRVARNIVGRGAAGHSPAAR
jgi:hypothetical protein